MIPPPSTGEARRGAVLIPIEQLIPGQYVYAHDGTVRRVRRVIRRPYRGAMIGLRHPRSEQTLWLTADHRVLAKLRPRSLGGQRDWSGVPQDHRQYRRQLRREMTSTERLLWSKLRNKGSGFKFRRQHPIGPYIVDFYCREAHLVVEVDGEPHFTEEARAYDMKRDEYMRALGLDILRFTTQDVRRNLLGVLLAIENQCRLRVESVDGAASVQAGNLLPGDIVFFGPEREAVPLEKAHTIFTEEEVYDLEVDGAHSFVTEVCAVHNCGSGTTAYCAEKWGRRWIICDTSRVAVAIARQRLMTAKFDYYELKDTERGPAGGIVYQTVPHITLESIARNSKIDEIAVRYQPEIDTAHDLLNEALGTQ
jgi:very-short-patch-repair endonuclease